MAIKRLKCPLNEDHRKTGPITNTFYSKYKLTAEEILLYEKLGNFYGPSTREHTEEKTEEEKTNVEPSGVDSQTAPDFHPVDCPSQFPSEPE
jgi:hypothetical protein